MGDTIVLMKETERHLQAVEQNLKQLSDIKSEDGRKLIKSFAESHEALNRTSEHLLDTLTQLSWIAGEDVEFHIGDGETGRDVSITDGLCDAVIAVKAGRYNGFGFVQRYGHKHAVELCEKMLVHVQANLMSALARLKQKEAKIHVLVEQVAPLAKLCKAELAK